MMTKPSLIAVIAALVGVCAAGGAAAQEEPTGVAPPPEAAPPTEGEAPADLLAGPVTEPAPVAEEAVPAELRPELRAVIEALAVGDYVAARAKLAAVTAALPADHWLQPSLAGLGRVADQLETRVTLACPEVGRDDESIASLYTTSTIFGFYTGVYLFGILGNLDVQATVPLSVVTAAAGLGGAYLLDQRDFLTGPVADGIAGGLLIGAAESVLILSAAADTDVSEELAFGLVWGGALIGAIAGGAVTDATGASRGDVALTTSAYGWGIASGGFVALIGEFDSAEAIFGTLAAGGAVGLGAGAALASQYEMSPARVLYINLGGLGGALVGLGIAVGAEMDSLRAVGVTLAATYLGGLGFGAYLTRNFDAPGPDVAFQALPTVLPSLDPLRRPVPGLAASLTW